MASLNKVMLIGNLTRDPEIKYTPKGTAIAQIGLAVNRTWSNEAGQKQEETTFVDIEFFGRNAEIAGEYLKKGRPAYIEGRLKLDSWEDKQSGQKRSRLKVIGESLLLLGGREGGASAGQDEPRQRSQGTPNRMPPPKTAPDPDLDAADDDIPF
jgi:single-strand DNA-binding protein